MDDTPRTLTYTATVYGPKGPRYLSVSLPFIECIADEPHYQPPPKVEKTDAAERMTKRRIRQALGRDPEPPMKRDDAVAYAATMRRIKAEGY